MSHDDNLVLGIDVGSSEVKVVVCTIGDKGDICICGKGASVVAGLSRGEIIDVDQLMVSIDRAVKRAAVNHDVDMCKVVVNIPLFDVKFVHNMGNTLPI